MFTAKGALTLQFRDGLAQFVGIDLSIEPNGDWLLTVEPAGTDDSADFHGGPDIPIQAIAPEIYRFILDVAGDAPVRAKVA